MNTSKTVTPSISGEDAEMVAYSDFHETAMRKSRFIPNATVQVADARGVLTCPRCGEHQPGLLHAEDTTCPECNLRMQLYGNGLTLWEV